MKDFVAGERVCLVDRYRTPLKILTIVKIGKRKMTLSDGSEWRADGRKPWGNDDPWYMGNHVVEVGDRDEQDIRIGRLVRWATSARWGVVPLEVLEQVYTLVKPEIDAWEARDRMTQKEP